MKRPNLNKKEIAEFCRRHHIRKLSFFGSVLRDDFNEGSDVDVLVEFDAGHTPGFIRLTAMERELTNLIGTKVDLRTLQDLSRYFRDQVLATARTAYAS
jgi:uncharacterized protein